MRLNLDTDTKLFKKQVQFVAFQYQLLAEQIAQKIYTDELSNGQKLSSLREFAKQHKVSLNTAKSCYELLEAQGLIYSKNKSGYYIKNNKTKILPPQYDNFCSHAREVSNLDLQIEIQNAAIDDHLIQLGSIQLSPELIPVVALRRSIQRALKMSKPEDFLYSDR